MALMPARPIPDGRSDQPHLVRRGGVARFVLMAAVGVGLCGCRGDSAREMIAANHDTNIKRLGTLYGFFHLRNAFRGPRDEAEFRAFIAAQDATRLALAGIRPTSMDDLFMSERDRLPFRIRYGVDTRVRGPALPVVFEQTGRDGRRQVGFTGGLVQTVDTPTYDVFWSGGIDGGSDAGSGQRRGL